MYECFLGRGLRFFDPVLIKKLTITLYSDSRAVIMVTTTAKGKAAAKSTCIFVFVHFLK
jgi:hypothetical protein